MSQLLVEVTRGHIVECVHMGDIAVVDNKGNLLYHAGDPFKMTYIRSSAKPIQAMEVILSGAYDKYGFSKSEMAIMCASHYAEDCHREQVQSILNKIGLDKDSLLCGTTTSLNYGQALKIAARGDALSPLYNNCSGKHSGMLSVCIHKDYSLKDYNKIDHPIQKTMKRIVAKMCSMSEESIMVGIDGCGVPVFGMPIFNMALAYAKLSNPEVLEDDYRKATNIIYDSMIDNPQLIAGTGGFCTELIRNSNGKLIGKLGAEGVYCIGVKDKNIGIALKIENGNPKVMPPAIIQVLEELGVLSEEELSNLSSFKMIKNTNSLGDVVGFIRPVFNLVKEG